MIDSLRTSAKFEPLNIDCKHKIKGSTNFSSQSIKNFHISKIDSSNEGRFLSFNTNPAPLTSHRYELQYLRRKPKIDLSKGSGHKPPSIVMLQMQYEPKMTVVYQRPDTGVMRFDKMGKKEYNFANGILNANTTNLMNIEKGYKAINPAIKTPSFTRNKLAMNKPKNLGFPRFMVVNLS